MVDKPGAPQFGSDFLLRRPVAHGRDRPETDATGGPAQMSLQHLADIHTTGHAERTKTNVDRTTVVQIGHIFDRDDLGNNTLVTVAAGHLVTLGYFASLGNAY